jgi:hypothetical protein
MKNIDMVVKGKKLLITVDLDVTATPSQSGKSEVLASTRGNIAVPGTDLKIGLNVYRSVQS